MANKFVRNITNVRNIEKQEKVTNNQNDLLSDKNHAYIRNNNEYHCLTDNVKSINGNKPNDKGEVSLDVGVKNINGVKPTKEGGSVSVNINVNGGHVEIEESEHAFEFMIGDVVKSINGEAPDSSGNIVVGGGSQAKLAVVENQHVVTSAFWSVRLNKELTNPTVIITKYIDEWNKEIEADRITFETGDGYTQINVNLEDDIRTLCGCYEMIIHSNDYPQGGIYVTNPIYNNANMTPYVNGILPGVNSDFAISFRTNAMNELINSGEFNFWIGADKLSIEQVTELDHDLPPLNGGQNYLRLEYNNRTIWADVVTKLP